MSYRYKWISVLVVLVALIPQALAESDQDTKLRQLSAEKRLLQKQTARQRAEIAKLKKEIDTLKKQLAEKSLDSDTSVKPVPKPDPPKPQTDWPKEWEASFQQVRSDVPQRIAEQYAIIKRANRANSRERVRQAEREIRRLKSGGPPSASLEDVKHGTIVRVDKDTNSEVRVVQVVGPTTFRGDQFRSVAYSGGGGFVGTRGAGPGSVRASRSPTVFFDGVSTKGLVDGAESGLTGYFITSGTRTFSAANGARRTEFVLTPLDIVKWQEAYKKWGKANPVQKKPSRRK